MLNDHQSANIGVGGGRGDRQPMDYLNERNLLNHTSDELAKGLGQSLMRKDPLVLPVLVAGLGFLVRKRKAFLLGWLLLATPVAAQAQFNYTVTNGTVTITGYTGTNGVVAIPSTIDGLPVTSIGDWAFLNRTDVTSVTIPNSVTNIGRGAFYGTSLTSVTIPNSVTSIGDGAFRFDSLTDVSIPNSVTNIGVYAFSGTRLTNVTIPHSVTSIGFGAFYDCRSLLGMTVEALNPAYLSVDGVLFDKNQTMLIQYPIGQTGTSYTIPNSVISIGDSAFHGCTGLTNVTIGSSVISIGDNAFYGTSLTSVTIPNSVTSIGDSAFDGCTNLTNVTTGSSVTNIADNAFSGCTSLTSVTIPNSVTNIGVEAFYGCTSLTNVTIGSSVTSIGDYAFYGCTSLTTITVNASNPVYSSVNGVLFDKNQAMLLEYPTGQTGTSYTIPNSVTNIVGYSFFGCTSLTSVTIPNSATRIGGDAFSGCTSLTSITIPSSVTSIGDYTFSGCSSLTNIMVDPLNSAYSSVDGVLFDKNQATLLEYPLGQAGMSHSYTIPNSVTSIGDGAFSGCTGLTNVIIPESVMTLGIAAFGNCTSLTSITIPKSVSIFSFNLIHSVTFVGCTNLSSAFFEGNAPIDDGTAFVDNNKVTIFYLPGTSGWTTNYGGAPTAVWTLPYPVLLSGSLGVQANGFGFTVSWATNASVVVEATTDLKNSNWSPVQTNALNNGVMNFTDSEWTKYPSRFYRVRSQ